MKLLIDIPEETYKNLLNNYSFSSEEIPIISLAIATGTPLPKGHGRLIDADTYRKEMLDSREFDFFKRLDMQPTIIEADEDGETGKTDESDAEFMCKAMSKTVNKSTDDRNFIGGF